MTMRSANTNCWSCSARCQPGGRQEGGREPAGRRFVRPSANPNSIGSFSSREEAPARSPAPEPRGRQDTGSPALPGSPALLTDRDASSLGDSRPSCSAEAARGHTNRQGDASSHHRDVFNGWGSLSPADPVCTRQEGPVGEGEGLHTRFTGVQPRAQAAAHLPRRHAASHPRAENTVTSHPRPRKPLRRGP